MTKTCQAIPIPAVVRKTTRGVNARWVSVMAFTWGCVEWVNPLSGGAFADMPPTAGAS